MHISAFTVYDEFISNPYFVPIIVEAIKNPIQQPENHNIRRGASIIKQVKSSKAMIGV